MRVLFLQPTAPGLPAGFTQYSNALAMLLASVRAAGHEVDLLGLGDFDEELLHNRLLRSRAEIVCLWLRSVNLTLARRIGQYVMREHQLPVIAAGPHPSADPDGTLSLPGITAVVLGEAERPTVDLLSAYRTGSDFAAVRGVWFNSDAGVVRNEAAALVADLDDLPWPDRSLFGFREILRRTGTAEFAVARGCPNWCGYCLNDRLAQIHQGKGAFARRRSVDNLVAEIRQVKADFPDLVRTAFTECTFTFDADWLARFAVKYKAEVGLPFSCHVRANRFDAATADRLAEAGCDTVHIDVISGSNFIRNEVFTMDTTDADAAQTFALLRQRGIRTVARQFVGSPYENDATLEETARLNRDLKPDAVRALVFHPFPGTSAAELCREHGWTSNRGDEDFFRNKSLLDLRGLRPDRISRERDALEAAVETRGSARRRLRVLSHGDGPPLDYREDGTGFSPAESPVNPADAAAIAADLAPTWHTVRSGLLLCRIGLAAALGGLFVVAACAPFDTPVAGAAVVLGFYGGLFGAVAWIGGYIQCFFAPARVQARGRLAGSLLALVAAAGVAWFLRGRWLADAGSAAPMLLFLAAAIGQILWATSHALFAGFLESVADFFSGDSAEPDLDRYRRFNRIGAVGGIALAALPLLDPEAAWTGFTLLIGTLALAGLTASGSFRAGWVVSDLTSVKPSPTGPTPGSAESSVRSSVDPRAVRTADPAPASVCPRCGAPAVDGVCPLCAPSNENRPETRPTEPAPAPAKMEV